jgi:hypothetical protein
MKKYIFAIVFSLTFSVYHSYGCTLAGKSLSKFDQTEYIFIGEVTGYTEPFNFNESEAGNSLEAVSSTSLNKTSNLNKSKASGLIVEVKESVHLPQIPKEHFEIFPYILHADCSVGGKTKEELAKDFPIHSEIQVIAKEAIWLRNFMPNGNIKLEERPGELSNMSLNFDENNKSLKHAVQSSLRRRQKAQQP